MSKKTDKPDDKQPVAAAVATPPEPPPEKPPEEKELTDEELVLKSQEFSRFMWPAPGEHKKKPEPITPPEKELEPVAKEPDAEPEPKKEPEKEPEPPPAPKKDKPLPPPISEAVKPEDLQAPKPRQEPAPVALDTDDEEQETLAGLERMERDGKVERGTAAKMRVFWKDKLKPYIVKWEEEHPDEEYNPNAAEHADFYEKNEPEHDPVELKRAVKANLKDEIKREAKAEVKQENDAETYQREMAARLPQTAIAVHEALKAMVAESGFKDLMEKDGKLVLDKTVEQAIDEASPHARSILLEEAETLTLQIAEIDKFKAFPGKYQLDPNYSKKTSKGAHILPHRMLQDFALTLEGELSALPPEQSARDGKRFVTNDEFTAQVDKIMSSAADPKAKSRAFANLNSHYYTLGWEDIESALIQQHAVQSRARIDQLGGIKKAAAAPEPAKTVQPPKVEDPPPKPAPTRAPSVSSSSDNVDTGKKAPVTSTITDEQFNKSMWP